MERTRCPKSRTIVLLVVIGCVLLAGCAGLGGDSTEGDDETNETAVVNDTTDDPAEANDTTNDSEAVNDTNETGQADQPDAEDGGEMNESDPDADASPTPENGSETDESDGADGTDEAGQTDQTDQTVESDETDGAEEPTETDGADEGDEAKEYASPDDVRVEGVTHMESQAGLDRDEITLSNTNDEFALPVGGWEIAFEEGDQRIPIEEGTIIEPGETRTIQLGDGEKVLNETGGIVHLYDAEGNHVGSWDHVGSPSGPLEADDLGETGYVQFEVVGAESDEGVENADVALGSDDRFTGSTDGAGVTTIREIPYGEYDLTVEHEQYTSHSETITVDESGTEMTVELEFSESGEATARTSTAGTLRTSA